MCILIVTLERNSISAIVDLVLRSTNMRSIAILPHYILPVRNFRENIVPKELIDYLKWLAQNFEIIILDRSDKTRWFPFFLADSSKAYLVYFMNHFLVLKVDSDVQAVVNQLVNQGDNFGYNGC